MMHAINKNTSLERTQHTLALLSSVKQWAAPLAAALLTATAVPPPILYHRVFRVFGCLRNGLVTARTLRAPTTSY